MAKIHVLDTLLINKIAAGEVIERPASVVKELVENSIDAGASSITIEIRDGGISYIRITDNGKGIAPDEVKTAFLRHATSKLESFDDLMSILTLGFRGEALSSIASVAQVELTTRVKDEESGVKVELSGGKIISEERVAANVGTTFVMKNLFYNTPARRKFLKKPATESGHISDMINKIALGHPHISFKFINNGSVILHTSGNNDVKTAVFHIYGKEAAKKMLPLEISKDSFTLKGMIGKPELSRGNRSYENFFVNGRFIKSPIVQQAVEDAYQGRLMVGKFPVFVIDLTVPANTVDVNVHPAKLEVRFSDEDFIYDLVKKGVEKALKSEESLIPNVEWDKTAFKEVTGGSAYKTEKQRELEELLLEEEDISALKTEAPKNEEKSKADIFYKTENIKNEQLFANEALSIDEDSLEIELNDRLKAKNEGFERALDKLYQKNALKLEQEKEENKNSAKDIIFNLDNIEKKADNNKEVAYLANEENKWAKKENTEEPKKKAFFNNYKIIGQIFNTYWIVEQEGSMFMIDQHAAHERVLYESLVADVKAQGAVSQKLLQSIAVNLSLKEAQVVKDNMKLFEAFGFELEEFGENTYAVRAVPFIFKAPVSPSFFVELVDLLADDKSIESIYETKLDLIATMSCKAAVKGNDRLSFIEAKALIEKLLKLENPFSCPHGRPTVIEMSKYEIEKKFKRIQN